MAMRQTLENILKQSAEVVGVVGIATAAAMGVDSLLDAYPQGWTDVAQIGIGAVLTHYLVNKIEPITQFVTNKIPRPRRLQLDTTDKVLDASIYVAGNAIAYWAASDLLRETAGKVARSVPDFVPNASSDHSEHAIYAGIAGLGAYALNKWGIPNFNYAKNRLRDWCGNNSRTSNWRKYGAGAIMIGQMALICAGGAAVNSERDNFYLHDASSDRPGDADDEEKVAAGDMCKLNAGDKILVVGSSSLAPTASGNNPRSIRLVQKYCPDVEITNVAKARTSISQIKGILKEELKEDKYDEIILFAGRNDIPNKSGARIVKHLDEMVEMVDDHGAHLIAITLPPFDEYKTWKPGHLRRVSAVNSWLRDHQNGKVYVADWSKAVIDPNNPAHVLNKYMGRDELHLSPRGQDKLAELIMNYTLGRQLTPGSEEQISVYQKAAKIAGVPPSWAKLKSLHNLMRSESENGKVGIPNYTIKVDVPQDGKKCVSANKYPGTWPTVHTSLQDSHKWINPASCGRGTNSTYKNGKSKSKATGLGQLNGSNTEQWYPKKWDSIGVAVDEAVGMLKYIKSRYGHPDKAWKEYNTHHEGY